MRAAGVLAAVLVASAAHGATPQWMTDAARTPSPVTDARAVVLLDERLVTVRESGEIVRTARRVYRIHTPEGRDLGRAVAHFGGDVKLTALNAWAVTSNGMIRESSPKEAIETAEFSGELYSDKKLRMVSVAADVGSIVAVESAIAYPAQALQDAWRFEDELPVVVARYILTLPPQWKHEARWIRTKASEPVVQGSSLVFERRDIPALTIEAGMPSIDSVAAMMAVNFVPSAGTSAKLHRSWSEVGTWYAGLTADRQALSPAMQAKARELTANKSKAIDKIAALAAFAQRDVRYVAIEIGIGSHRPHAAQEVFATRYGDCKDKVTILGAMLRELGVESYYVLASTERGTVERDFASLQSFNHAIIAIRLPADAPPFPASVKHARLGNVLLFDPTSETTPFGQLPPYLQENRVLLVTPTGGELLDVGSHVPDTNRLERRAKLSVDEDGTLTGSVHETRSGSIAAGQRGMLQALDAAGRTKAIERSVTGHLARAAVRDVVFENLDDPSADLIVHYAIEVPSYARKAGALLMVRPRVIGRKADALFEQKERKHPYETSGTSLEIDEIEIAVPAARVEELPKPLDIDTPTARYRSEATFADGVLKYRRRYELRRVVVPAAAIADLNKTFAQILADERATALLR